MYALTIFAALALTPTGSDLGMAAYERFEAEHERFEAQMERNAARLERIRNSFVERCMCNGGTRAECAPRERAAPVRAELPGFESRCRGLPYPRNKFCFMAASKIEFEEISWPGRYRTDRVGREERFRRMLIAAYSMEWIMAGEHDTIPPLWLSPLPGPRSLQ